MEMTAPLLKEGTETPKAGAEQFRLTHSDLAAAIPLDSEEWALPPTWKTGKPTIVHAKFSVERLCNIDTKSSSASVRVLIWLSWIDERIIHLPKNTALPAMLWTPHLRLGQQDSAGMVVEVSELGRKDEFRSDVPPGSMYKLMRFEGIVYNEMDHLESFPFDHDRIELSFRSCERKLARCSDHDIDANFKRDYRVVLEEGEWWMKKPSMPDWHAEAVQLDYVEIEGAHDIVRFTVYVSRNSMPYLRSIVIPLILITGLNFLGFVTPVEELADRMAHIVALFLTALALLLVVSNDLPKTSSTSVMDWLILTTLILLAISAMHVSYEYLVSAESNAVTIIAAYGSVFVVLVVGILFPSYLRRLRQKRMWAASAWKTTADKVPRIFGHACRGHPEVAPEGAPTVQEHCTKIVEDPCGDWPDWLKAYGQTFAVAS